MRQKIIRQVFLDMTEVIQDLEETEGFTTQEAKKWLQECFYHLSRYPDDSLPIPYLLEDYLRGLIEAMRPIGGLRDVIKHSLITPSNCIYLEVEYVRY